MRCNGEISAYCRARSWWRHAARRKSPDAPKTHAAEPSTQRYANMPVEAVPYGKFTKPYKEWFLADDTLAYNGAARDRVVKEIIHSKTVNIGFLGPIENNPESPYGLAMLHGAQLAIDEANARRWLWRQWNVQRPSL